MSQVEVELRAGYLVKRVQQLLRQACDDELRPSSLTMAQYAVLRALADHPGVSAAELARLCFVTRQSLQDVLTGLRTAELVTVAPPPERGRARPVTLTREGERRLRAANEAMAAVEERMVKGLSPGQRRELGALLSACADNLSR